MLRSDPKNPARAAIQIAGGEARDLAPDSIPPEFPAAALVVPQPVMLSAADGMRIHGQLFLPPDLKPGEKRPAMIFFHGGSRRQMLLGWHYMGYYHNAYGMNQYLASQGYEVLAVNYRSGIGYGLDFREAINYGAAGASEFKDVLGAGLYLRGYGLMSTPSALACGAAPTAAISRRSACRALPICSPPASTSTASTTGARCETPSRRAIRFEEIRMPSGSPLNRRRWHRSTPGARPCCSSTAMTTAMSISAKP